MNEHDALTVNQLESQITAEKEYIELEQALFRLRTNPDYIRIIDQGYLQDAALRLVAFTGSPECVNQIRANTQDDIQAIGKFRAYLGSINRNARRAEVTIDQAREMISSIEQGEAE